MQMQGIFCVNKQSQVALNRHRACTNGREKTFGEQHDREAEGLEVVSAYSRKAKQSQVALNRHRACTNGREKTFGEQQAVQWIN
jgi:ubiquitin